MNCALHVVTDRSKVSDIRLTKEKPVQDESDVLVEALDIVAVPSLLTVGDPDIVLRILTSYSRPALARVLLTK
jgi:hypothetical protein